MTHDPYSCAECDRVGWYHEDDEPWPTATPTLLPVRRDMTLILLGVLGLVLLGVIAWTAARA